MNKLDNLRKVIPAMSRLQIANMTDTENTNALEYKDRFIISCIMRNLEKKSMLNAEHNMHHPTLLILEVVQQCMFLSLFIMSLFLPLPLL